LSFDDRETVFKSVRHGLFQQKVKPTIQTGQSGPGVLVVHRRNNGSIAFQIAAGKLFPPGKCRLGRQPMFERELGTPLRIKFGYRDNSGVWRIIGHLPGQMKTADTSPDDCDFDGNLRKIIHPFFPKLLFLKVCRFNFFFA
jgi:hypothetical protein